MAHVIRLTEVTGSHSTSINEEDILVNDHYVVNVKEAYEHDLGNTRILLANGKSIFVQETMSEIEDMINHGSGGGLFGGGGKANVR